MGLKQSPLFALVASSTKHSSTMHFIHGPHKVHSLGLHRNRDKNKSYWFNRFYFFDKKKTDLISVEFVSGPKTHLHNKSYFDRISFVACGVCFSYVHKLGGLLFYFLLFYHQTQPMSANQETLAISICSSPLLLPVLLISELNFF